MRSIGFVCFLCLVGASLCAASFEEFFELGEPLGWVKTESFEYEGRMSLSKPLSLDSNVAGFVCEDEAKHFGYSKIVSPPISNKDKDIVLQYEVKAQNYITCGGAYLKFLPVMKTEELGLFTRDVKYSVMFGPDRCGDENRVHLIIQRENQLTHEMVEHHLKNKPRFPEDKFSHVYTVVIKPTNEFSLLVDGVVEREGSMYEEFEPPIEPPKEIDDPDDKKPDDWVDDAQIPDPDSVKPEDWDEDAPRTIPDPEAEMPADWLLDEPLMVPDPDAEKPDDWDDEFDGDWEAPEVDNAECEGVSGCGPWTPPQIPNPEYRGKWEPEMIDNPAYIGRWAPRKIPNADFYEVSDPHTLVPIGAVSIEIWTMVSGTMFKNIFISNDVAAAEEVRETRWRPVFEEEKRFAAAKEAKENSASTFEKIVGFLMSAIKERNPVAIATIVCVALLPISLLIFRKKGDAAGVEDDDSDVQPAADKEEHVDEPSEPAPSSSSSGVVTTRRRKKKSM